MTVATQSLSYRGRFAPSPTGDLHFGSLVAAVGSYLQARVNAGQWLLRVEDLDPPREVPGSARRIIDDLARFGMEPDEPVLYQSTRTNLYQQAVNRLLSEDKAYWCGCSRSAMPADGIYPGTCRNGLPADKQPRAVRLRVDHQELVFRDRIQGLVNQDLARQVGDFIIRRADGLIAYQLAVVIDDEQQQITEVVRGADLLDSTARQIFLQRQLGLPSPEYAHLPVVTDLQGKKLSKRLQSDPVVPANPLPALRQAMQFLGHEAPSGLTSRNAFWAWAVANWCLQKVPAASPPDLIFRSA